MPRSQVTRPVQYPAHPSRSTYSFPADTPTLVKLARLHVLEIAFSPASNRPATERIGEDGGGGCGGGCGGGGGEAREGGDFQRLLIK